MSIEARMRVLGIDPGSRFTGYAVVEKAQGGGLSVVASGAISVAAGLDLPEKLLAVSRGIEGVIEAHRPDSAAVEAVFFAKNARSAITLGQVRGVSLLAASRAGLKVFEYAPSAVKMSVTGYGAAAKEDVQKMVRLLLKTRRPLGTDESDALALAVCHIHSALSYAGVHGLTAPKRAAKSWRSFSGRIK